MRKVGDLRPTWLSLVMLFVLAGSSSWCFGQGDFRQLTDEERAEWIESVFGTIKNQSDAPAAREQSSSFGPADAGLWRQFKDGRRWRLDRTGYVVLEGGQRPLGARTFVRACFERYGNRFRHWVSVYGKGIKIAHLIAVAVTETGCPSGRIATSVDGKSSGLMQVTGTTCRHLLRYLGRPATTGKACMNRMAEDHDFSIELAAAYITHPDHLELSHLDPPKIAAVYNAGGLYYDPRNPWRLRSTGNHIDRFVSAYNTYLKWEESDRRTVKGPRTRSIDAKQIVLAQNPSLPLAVGNRRELDGLRSIAQEGNIVFAGNWKTKAGDYYVFFDGKWQGSMEP